MDFADAFTLWRGLGVDYEGGVLGNASRVAIHVSHRLGAVVTAITLLLVAFACFRASDESPVAGQAGVVLFALLLVQVGLGIANVILHLPLAVATAHNGGAALLVLSLVFLIHHSRPAPKRAAEAFG